MVFPDLRDDGSLAADDFGMELGIYGHGDLEAAQGLKRDEAAETSRREDRIINVDEGSSLMLGG